MAYIQPQAKVLLNAVTATSTSIVVGVQNAGRLSIMVTGNAISSGNGVFQVWVSNDPSLGFTPYNRITTNVTNTNAQFDTRAASVTLSANGTQMLFFPPGDTFAYLKISATRTTDGTYSAVAYID